MVQVITNRPGLYLYMVMYDLDLDKGRKEEKMNEKKFGDSKPRNFQKEMALEKTLVGFSVRLKFGILDLTVCYMTGIF